MEYHTAGTCVLKKHRMITESSRVYRSWNGLERCDLTGIHSFFIMYCTDWEYMYNVL